MTDRQYTFHLDCPACGADFSVASDMVSMIREAADALQGIHERQHELIGEPPCSEHPLAVTHTLFREADDD